MMIALVLIVLVLFWQSIIQPNNDSNVGNRDASPSSPVHFCLFCLWHEIVLTHPGSMRVVGFCGLLEFVFQVPEISSLHQTVHAVIT